MLRILLAIAAALVFALGASAAHFLAHKPRSGTGSTGGILR